MATRKSRSHRSAISARDIFDNGAPAVAELCIDMALRGNIGAMKLVLERSIPIAKERPVDVRLPDLSSADACANALMGVVKALSAGELRIGEAASIAGLIDSQRRNLETRELESRLKALEGRK